MAIFHSRGSVWYGAAAGAPSASTLRVKGVAFSANQIIVRDGKGHKNRVTLLPAAVKASPERKYPNTDRAWTWQTVFPATRTYVDRLTRRQRRPLHDIWTVQTAARPQRREHHDDLHARPQSRPGLRHQSRRPPPRHKPGPDRSGAAGRRAVIIQGLGNPEARGSRAPAKRARNRTGLAAGTPTPTALPCEWRRGIRATKFSRIASCESSSFRLSREQRG
jgi:hypothetical protein